jgi:beta-lactam-binding protein with PASTA domain
MKFPRFLISKVFFKNLLLAVGIFIVFVTGTFLWLNIYTHHGKAHHVPDLTGLSIQEIDEVLRKNRFRYLVEDSVYTNMVKRGTVFEQNPEPGFKVKKNRMIFLTMNAVNPDSVSMPGLLGYSLRQARTMLENAGLKLGKMQYLPDIAVNNVLNQKFQGQNIEPGRSIVKGASIDLDLGKGLSSEKTIVPELMELSLEEAQRKILGASLNMGAVTYDPEITTMEDSSSAFVWKQIPVFDRNVPVSLGTPVYLWLTNDSIMLPQADTLGLERDF